MATTIFAGPYYQFTVPPGRGLRYGELQNFVWGPHSFFDSPGTFTVTAHALTESRNVQYAMWVNDMSISTVDVSRAGAIFPNNQCRLHVTFGNNGSADIDYFVVSISKVIP